MSEFSFANIANAEYVEGLYQQFKADPESIPSSWKLFFAGMEFMSGKNINLSGNDNARESALVEALIYVYRRLGHLSADIQPLFPRQTLSKDLLPENHGLENISYDQEFFPANYGDKPQKFSHILESLQKTYCGFVGADFRELNDIEAVIWLQKEMEGNKNSPTLTAEQKKRILSKLQEADGFEKFLQARYLGQKRFSLEGLDSLIPLLDFLLDEAALAGVEEAIIGMAHRGRLNVLANTMGKPYEKIFSEFEGSEFNPFDIDGDVKYHLGFGTQVKTFRDKDMLLYLSPNPSHLEAVNPLVEGFARKRQEERGDTQKVLPILLHGDAAFIGQGLVAETLNLSGLESYQTGGTIHIITNNNIGFTTEPSDSRSCEYSSDISKVIRAPVFHVNADQPEAVVWVAILAARFRNKFKRDVVIDLVGYRRHGHNETDEPAFTQPLLYKGIKDHPPVVSLYQKKLIDEQVIAEEKAHQATKHFADKLQTAFEAVRKPGYTVPKHNPPAIYTEIFKYKKPERSEILASYETKVSEKNLKELAEKITHVPASFNPHAKIERLLESRRAMIQGDGNIDWAFAELLAFSSLAAEGKKVRLSGQDCKRGTFSSRHGVLFDFNTGKEYEPLKQIGDIQIINSPLSEQGCLGFEFGYSIASPETLVLWEAQFGDFANGAQIIIDQFLVASEAKWSQTSQLVLLLPHGYEGMGPEHSSARPERFLQLCGNLNIQVANVTTPAQYFHILRRQMKRHFKKPLVMFTPKSLLRHPQVISPLKEFTQGSFQEAIDDHKVKDAKRIERVVLCTGKIYFELEAKREESKIENTAIIRLEQIYPFPYEKLAEIMKKYQSVKDFVWTQEEPLNMGAWTFVRPRISKVIPSSAQLSYIGRKTSGSTAEGSGKSHKIEQARIIDESMLLAKGWEGKIVAQIKA